MKAVKFTNSLVHLAEIPVPDVGDTDVLVKVSYAAVNAADLLQATGRYSPPKGTAPDLLGLEFSGTIIAQGINVPLNLTNLRVMGITSGAAQAEFLVIRFDQVITVPTNMTLLEAGAIPEAYITAYDAIFSQGNYAIGKRVLITGASGGVGSAAVSLAITAGGIVFGSSRQSRGRQFVSGIGGKGIAPEEIQDHAPYDLIIELVGGSSIAPTLSNIAIGGTIVVIGLSSNPTVELNLQTVMQKRAIIRGSTLRSRSLFEKASIVSTFARDIVPLFEERRIRPYIDSVYDAQDVHIAYENFKNNPKFGKLLLKFDS